MLTATNYMEQSVKCGSGDSSLDIPLSVQDHVIDDGGQDRPRQLSSSGFDLVSGYMSTGVQSIAAESALLDAARQMCRAHLHRLPVVDGQGHVLGMVSSLDIASALVGAMEE